MSVTITISNNKKYVDQNCSEKINIIVYPEDDFYPKFTEKNYPFEMNMANGNFHTVMSALGLDMDYVGSMDARILYNALKKTHPEMFERITRQDGIVTFCGIGINQAESYHYRLYEICEEAIKREEKLVWC
jgi:hypothetical protein